MLVLSRKQNQTIVIDGQIEIEVLKIKGNTVRLGIRAPQEIKVLRGELSPFELEFKQKPANETSEAEQESSEKFPALSIAHAV